MADEKTVDPFKGMTSYDTGAPASTSEAHQDAPKKEPKDEKNSSGGEVDDKNTGDTGTGDDGGGDDNDLSDIFDDDADNGDDDDDSDGVEDDGKDDESSDDDNEDPAEDSDDPAEDSDDPVENKDKRKRNKKAARARIAELTKYRRTAENALDAERQRNATLEQRLAALEKKLTPAEEDGTNKDKSDQDDVGAPDPNKYAYGELDPKYVSDLTDYRVDKRLAKDKSVQEEKQQTQAVEQQAKELETQYSVRKTEGRKVYKDFDKVVVEAAKNNEYPLTHETAMMALESPVGHHVMYKIASNPKLAKKLAGLNVIQQARAFGRLEAQFSSKDASRKNKTPLTPPPPKRRSGGSGISDVNPSKENFADFEKRVNASYRDKK